MELRIHGIETERVDALRAGGPDANGHAPLVRGAQGIAPCRHCLGMIAEGDPMLVLGYRAFDEAQPYAEVGPIYLHARPEDCPRYDASVFPGWFDFLDPAVIRGYDADHWIRYETGAVVSGKGLLEACAAILQDPTVGYVHVRTKFGCYLTRVDRADVPR